MTRSRGFTLVEILVALAVLSVGLLGAAMMLLGSLRGQAAALREVAATHLLCGLAERIRIHAVLQAADREWFEAGARGLDAQAVATIEFEPATGPGSPDRYRMSLHFADSDALVYELVRLEVPVRAPVAG